MLYMARTAHIQEDESIRCEGVAEADAAARPWALLALTEREAGGDRGWRLVGTYPDESSALSARRRLSRRMGSTSSAPPVRREGGFDSARRSTDFDRSVDRQGI
jgi:hypothetical protein